MILVRFSDTLARDEEGKAALHYCASSKATAAFSLAALLVDYTDIGKWITLKRQFYALF